MNGLHPLDRKLLRDLVRLRGQALAIALIVASGVAVLCSSLALVEALDETANAFYDRQHFAHVFASARRAPRRLLARIRAIAGVQAVDARVVEHATLDVAGFEEPISGALVSLAREGAVLNRPLLRTGTRPHPQRADEVLVSEAFAEAHGLAPGDTFGALIDGHHRTLTVTGTALSPEYVYAIGPGALMPDARRYAILWLGEDALRAAFDLEGAFNDVALTLTHDADLQRVIRALDDLLARYGGSGAVARADQLSNWFVMNEIRQLRSIAGVLPVIFLVVAAFLSNMVLARLVATERSEIGLLKAFGYGNATVAWHYAKLVLAMIGAGVLLGWLCGWWLGYWTSGIYAGFFRFPQMYYNPGPGPFVLAATVSLVTGLAGALGAVRRASMLGPAEAMRPPAPPVYRRAGHGSDATRRVLDHLTRIVLRQLLRWPLRAALTSFGVAASVAVLVMSLQWTDAIALMVDAFFFDQQRQDVTVTLNTERSLIVREAFRRLPGVLAVEAHRKVPARLRNGHRVRRQPVNAVPAHGSLEVLRDASGARLTVPEAGLVVARALAERLHVDVGDTITLEVLDGARPTVAVPVAAVFETPIGIPAYMRLDALNRLLGDAPVVDTVLLRVDPQALPALYRALKRTPAAASVTLRRAAVDNFNDTIAENLLITIAIYIGFACTLAAGVVYNSMRIALSERGRELATLRVLGFHGAEVSYLLLAEAAFVVVLALPLGCALGYALVLLISGAFETELFRILPVIEPGTFGVSVLVALGAALACGLVVHRRVARLDLIRVLKTRE